jgi:hypothetical protein
MLPDLVDPDCVMELATTTTILTGIVDGGLELFPGSEVQAAPQV